MSAGSPSENAERSPPRPSSPVAKPPSSRRFVALPVAAEIRDRLVASLPNDPSVADGLRWTRPDGWHLTMAFLGDVQDEQVDHLINTLEAGVAATTITPQRLEIGDIGTFGRRVLWVGVDASPEDSLRSLAEALRTALRGGGFPVDDRPLRPHVTLARAGRRPVTRRVVEACASAVAHDGWHALAWTPNAIELWRSDLGEGPAHYTTEATIALQHDPP